MCTQVPAVAAVLAVVYGIWNFLRSRQRVFLLDFACYKPPENLKVGLDGFMKGSKDSGVRILSSTLQFCVEHPPQRLQWGFAAL